MNIINRIGIFYMVVSSMLIISGCAQPTGSIKCTLKGVVIDHSRQVKGSIDWFYACLVAQSENNLIIST